MDANTYSLGGRKKLIEWFNFNANTEEVGM